MLQEQHNYNKYDITDKEITQVDHFKYLGTDDRK